jgi:CDP-glucose 4,6-dehydratase
VSLDFQAHFKGKRIIITGNTGFTGSWMIHALAQFGAEVFGFSLPPPTQPSMFELTQIFQNFRGDVGVDANVLNLPRMKMFFESIDPHIVIHLAAQPFVFESYRAPVETVSVNTLGTAHMLEACRGLKSLTTVTVVTTDKVYFNAEKQSGYGEDERLGGFDPYSASKAAAEIITESFARSFLKDKRVVTARAGNIIGGGDFSPERLIPNFVRAAKDNKAPILRDPQALRPWQHVLDAVAGYLAITAYAQKQSAGYIDAFNIGPDESSRKTVQKVIEGMSQLFNCKPEFTIENTEPQMKETQYLWLKSDKIKKLTGWQPQLNFEMNLQWTAEWYLTYLQQGALREKTSEQIQEFFS